MSGLSNLYNFGEHNGEHSPRGLKYMKPAIAALLTFIAGGAAAGAAGIGPGATGGSAGGSGGLVPLGEGPVVGGEVAQTGLMEPSAASSMAKLPMKPIPQNMARFDRSGFSAVDQQTQRAFADYLAKQKLKEQQTEPGWWGIEGQDKNG